MTEKSEKSETGKTAHGGHGGFSGTSADRHPEAVESQIEEEADPAHDPRGKPFKIIDRNR